jgi:hypothetical protein
MYYTTKIKNGKTQHYAVKRARTGKRVTVFLGHRKTTLEAREKRLMERRARIRYVARKGLASDASDSLLSEFCKAHGFKDPYKMPLQYKQLNEKMRKLRAFKKA